MVRKKKRRLRKRVYVILILLLVGMIITGSYFVKKKASKDYSFYQGEVTLTKISVTNDGFLYTYDQQYFIEEEKTYLSLNDLYNAYLHLNNGTMQLDQSKDRMSFKNDTTDIVLNYKKEIISFNACQWSQTTLEYLENLNVNKDELSLQKINSHAYIYEGEVYLEKEIVDKVLFNDQYHLDLENNTIKNN